MKGTDFKETIRILECITLCDKTLCENAYLLKCAPDVTDAFVDILSEAGVFEIAEDAGVVFAPEFWWYIPSAQYVMKFTWKDNTYTVRTDYYGSEESAFYYGSGRGDVMFQCGMIWSAMQNAIDIVNWYGDDVFEIIQSNVKYKKLLEKERQLFHRLKATKTKTGLAAMWRSMRSISHLTMASMLRLEHKLKNIDTRKIADAIRGVASVLMKCRCRASGRAYRTHRHHSSSSGGGSSGDDDDGQGDCCLFLANFLFFAFLISCVTHIRRWA